jgi:hypothetical protein
MNRNYGHFHQGSATADIAKHSGGALNSLFCQMVVNCGL